MESEYLLLGMVYMLAGVIALTIIGDRYSKRFIADICDDLLLFIFAYGFWPVTICVLGVLLIVKGRRHG